MDAVVFFHPRFSDGGVERTNIGLAKLLIGAGFHVVFATIDPTPHFRDEIGEAGIAFEVLPAHATLAAQVPFARLLRKLARLYDRLTVISCQYYVNVACVLFRPLWPRRVRLVLSERNHLDEFRLGRGLKHALVPMLVRIFYAGGDAIIANSQELAEDLSVYLRRPVQFVPNPTLNERLERLAGEPVVERWFLNDKRPTIVGLGRLAAQKDFATLIRAFALVRRQREARLVIFGEGPERPALTALTAQLGLEKDVLLPGFVDNPYKFIRASDLFVLSSAYEGLPNVLIEAIAVGCPVVSTLCRSGPREILLDGIGGELVPTGDPGTMAQAIMRVLNAPHAARAQGDSARATLGRYSPEAAGRQLLTVLDKTCNSARAAGRSRSVGTSS